MLGKNSLLTDGVTRLIDGRGVIGH